MAVQPQNVRENIFRGWGDLQVNDGWKGFPWRSGQVIWCGFDHGSIAGSQLGKMGIVDYFRIPKRSWYWYRNEYTGIKPPKWSEEGTPASLKLEATKTVDVLADGTEDVQLLISILDANGNTLSNSPKVQLKLISGPVNFQPVLPFFLNRIVIFASWTEKPLSLSALTMPVKQLLKQVLQG